jgi:hypothetical protein
LHTCRDRDHRRSKLKALHKCGAVTAPKITRRTFPISITMRPVVRAPGSSHRLSGSNHRLRKKKSALRDAIDSKRKVCCHVSSNDCETPCIPRRFLELLVIHPASLSDRLNDL